MFRERAIGGWNGAVSVVSMHCTYTNDQRMCLHVHAWEEYGEKNLRKRKKKTLTRNPKRAITLSFLVSLFWGKILWCVNSCSN